MSAAGPAKIGLALGGGAARGLAHLGVLEVLEEHGLRPHALAGTSVGSLIGGVWIATGSAEAAVDKVHAFVNSDDYRKAEVEYLTKAQIGTPSGWANMVSRALRRGVFLSRTYLKESFVSDENLRHNVEQLLPDADLGDLSVPFAVVASDLATAQSIVFRRGSLRQAVIASSAVPGLMPPQPYGDRLLTDGGLIDKIPARALFSMDVDLIIGVDVSSEFDGSRPLKRGIEIVSRANQVTEWNLRNTRKAMCDLMIRPDVQDIHWLNFSGAMAGALVRGRRAMQAAMPELEGLLRGSRVRRFFGRSQRQVATRLDERGWFGDELVELVAREHDQGALGEPQRDIEPQTQE